MKTSFYAAAGLAALGFAAPGARVSAITEQVNTAVKLKAHARLR